MTREEFLALRSDEGPAGDCPNPACRCGQIAWRRWSGLADLPPLYAGKCERCGQWAVQCPLCGDLVPIGEHVVECSCELCLVLAGTACGPVIELVTTDDVTRTYALSGE